MNFSAVESALAGFNLARKRPMLILAWTGLYVAAFAVLAVIAFLVAGPSLMSLADAAEQDDPEALLAGMGGLWILLAVFVPFVLLMSAMFIGAVYRAVLRPEEKKLAYVTLGGDEWRILAVTIVYTILAMAVGGGVIGVIAVVGSAVGDALGGLLVFLLVLAALVFGAWVSVRLSLVVVQTFAERRINLFGSWKLTAGRFWPMFGMWALTVIFAIILVIAISVLSYIPLLVGGGLAGLAQASQPDPSTMTVGIVIGLFLYAVIQMVGSILQSVVMYAPAAAAYQQLVGGVTQADTFN